MPASARITAPPTAKPDALCGAVLLGEEPGRVARIQRLLAAAGFRTWFRDLADSDPDLPGVGSRFQVLLLIPSGDARAAVDAIAALSGRRSGLSLLCVMPDDATTPMLRRALRAGADGLVFDSEVDDVLAPSLAAVAAGQMVLPAALRRHVALPSLTHRERECLALAVDGLTNSQIAGRLYLAESTVKTHLSSVFAKLGAGSRAEAAAIVLDTEDGPALGILPGAASATSRP
jgi:DNA-binding NarL/FixJ family response regulator